MRAIMQWLPVLVLALLLCWAVSLLVRVNQIRPLGLQVDEPNLDFGRQWSQDDFEHQFAIRNVTGSEVVVWKLTTSCACTTVEPDQFSLPPGETQVIRLKLDLTFGQTAHNGREGWERPFAVAVRAEAGERTQPTSTLWHVSGVVVDPVRFPVDLIDGGPSLIRGSAFPDVQLRIRKNPDCRNLAATCDSKFAEVALGDEEGEQQVLLTLKPNAAVPPGRHEFSVSFVAEDSSGELLPAVSIPVVCQVQQDVHAVPDRIAFRHSQSGGQGDAPCRIYRPAVASATRFHRSRV